MVDRFVDKLIRHAVKADMACQRDSTSTLTLKDIDIKHQAQDYVMHWLALSRLLSSIH